MASYTTTLTEHNSGDNMKVWSIDGHSALDPKLLIQKRRNPANPSANLETTVSVVQQTEDADGIVLPSRVVAEVRFKYPKLGQSADVTAVLALLREYVACDEFTTAVTDQAYIGP